MMTDSPLMNSFDGHDGAINAVATIAARNPAAVSAGNDQIIRIWDLERGILIGQLEGHTDSIRGISVTLNPRLLIVSGGYDNTVRIWDIGESKDPNISGIPDYLGIGTLNRLVSTDTDDDDGNDDGFSESQESVRYVAGLGFLYEDSDNEEEDKIMAAYADTSNKNSYHHGKAPNDNNNTGTTRRGTSTAVAHSVSAELGSAELSSLQLDITKRRASTGSPGRPVPSSRLL
jgi:hypothetical protein